MSETVIDKARRLVAGVSRISALTGAGISVDSGIPDFRSEGGLWKRYEPLEYATYDGFVRDPSKFWTMGRELAEVFLKARPNEAHIALAELERQGRLVGVITQNIDGLHQAAGCKTVIELHGNYLKAHCMECGREYIGEAIHRRVASGDIPPRCDECGGILKSEAVLFGEPLPENAMRDAIRICRNTELMLVVGTSLSVYPAAFLPQLAKNCGATIILVNINGINRDNVADLVIQGRASVILPKIISP